MIAGNRRFIDYDALGKPTAISDADAATAFWYDPSGARYKKLRGGGAVTYYIGKDYERIIAGGAMGASGEVLEKTYIGGYLVIENGPAGRRVQYLHGDRLGSIATVTDPTAARAREGIPRPAARL